MKNVGIIGLLLLSILGCETLSDERMRDYRPAAETGYYSDLSESEKYMTAAQVEFYRTAVQDAEQNAIRAEEKRIQAKSDNSQFVEVQDIESFCIKGPVPTDVVLAISMSLITDVLCFGAYKYKIKIKMECEYEGSLEGQNLTEFKNRPVYWRIGDHNGVTMTNNNGEFILNYISEKRFEMERVLQLSLYKSFFEILKNGNTIQMPDHICKTANKN